MTPQAHPLSRRRFGTLVAGVLAFDATAGTAARAAGPATTAPDRSGPATSAPSASALARVALPVPTGPHQIGTVSLHLIDRSRRDPWGVQPNAPRELMASVWYPARDTAKYPLAAQMLPGAAAGFDGANSWEVPPGAVNWAATKTHAHEGAPVDRRGGAHPVVLYSPGAGDPRTLGTVLVEELASRGYIVVTMDRTYETFVEFPGGRVTGMDAIKQAPQRPDGPWAAFLRKLMSVSEADTRFVLNELVPLDAGGNPDAERRRLPRGIAGALDLAQIGMFGHSAGGFTALQAMYDDRRIRAAVDMDGELNYAQSDVPGTPMSTVASGGLDRPFMLLGSKPHGRHNKENTSWGLLWKHSSGWRRDLYLSGSQHASFTDAEAIVPQLLQQRVISADIARADIGTVDQGRAVATNRAYLTAFFDKWLRHRDGQLLSRPSAKYPDMIFVE